MRRGRVDQLRISEAKVDAALGRRGSASSSDPHSEARDL